MFYEMFAFSPDMKKYMMILVRLSLFQLALRKIILISASSPKE